MARKAPKRDYMLEEELPPLKPKPPVGAKIYLVNDRGIQTYNWSEARIWTYLGAKQWHQVKTI